MKTISLGELSAKLSAQLHGSAELSVSSIKPLEEAGPGALSFFAPTSRRKAAKLLAAARETKATCLLVNRYDPALPCAQIVVPHPLGAISAIAELFFEPAKTATGVHPTAVISPTARLAPGVSIGAYAVIGEEVEIGAGCVIYPHVVIYDRARIGKSCVIHAHAVIREDVVLGDDCLIQNGVVLGGDGFGYFPDKQLGHRRIPHIGGVVLGDRVDVGANSTIDRAMLGDTRVGDATKIDNLVMVGHNCQVGERTLMCAMTGVSGSCEIGSDVILGGATGVADHVVIGDRSQVAARSGVTGSISADSRVGGYPHEELRKWRRQQALLRRLPEILKRTGASELFERGADGSSTLESDQKE